jgi:D-alanyl-D-alanine carboxypeptidase
MASVRTSGTPFSGRAEEIPSELRSRMEGVSWRPDDPRCPPIESLRLLTVAHWDFEGNHRTGQLVAAADLAEELLAIFRGLHELGFPIERMEPVDSFGADDNASMAANNTSAFNFRNVAGTDVLSHHAFGVAIDINPLLNPMVIGGGVYPPGGSPYTDRTALHPGMIVRPGPVVDLFQSHGWDWGGDWPHMKDYHHFFKPTRA